MKKVISLIFLLCFGLLAIAQQEAEFNCLIIDHKGKLREQFVDFEKLNLNLKFDTKKSMVYGKAAYNFRALRTNITHLFLDAPNILVKNITLNGKEIAFDYVEGGIDLIFDRKLNWETNYSLKIDYETLPQKGLYFVGWNDETNRARKQIWTQGQGIDNRYWIPGFDAVNDKLVTEMIITFEKGYEVISNGKLKSKFDNPKENTTTWFYGMEKPHSLYLIMLAIGEYDYRDYASNSGVTSRQYYYKDRKDAEKTTYAHTNKMMNWFESELGVPYQWKIYKNVPVANFMYGAMENTSATIYTDYYLQNERQSLERSYLGTNAHELAHQWFGDLVTEWSGSHHWLHESFATHYSKHFLKEVEPIDDFHWQRRKEQLAAILASRNNDLPVAHVEAGSSRHYSKGSFVLDMLRYVVGEDEYQRTVTDYLNNNAFDMVDSHDFQMAFMKSLGMDLDWFFNQWVYKGGEPEYLVEYRTKFNKTVFTVEQVQEQNQLVGLFKMPIEFEVHYKDGSFDKKTQWISNQKDTVILPNKGLKKVKYVLFDPNSHILKKVRMNKSYKELLAQASTAKNMLDRYDAVAALGDFDVEKKREDIIDLYLEEEYSAAKRNILKQLKNDEHPKTTQLFVYAMGEKDASLRRAAITYADISNKRYLKFYEEMLEDESYVNIELALEKLCYEYPDNIQEYLNRTRSIDGKNHNVKLTWLKIATDENSKLAGGLVDYSSESFEFRTRIKAIKIIQEKEYFDQNYMKNLINAYLSFNRRLSSTAAIQLKILLEQKEYSNMIAKYVATNEWYPHHEKKLKTLVEQYNKKVFR